MKNSELEGYLIQALNMALQINGETSYTNSFDVSVADEGFYFVPRLPASYVVDNELYQKIYLISNAVLYPDYTLLKQTGSYFVPLDTEDIHVKRALFFPWRQGISKRLIVRDIEKYVDDLPLNQVPVMENYTINLNKVTSIAIAGNSGSGKSYVLTYFLCVLKKSSRLVIIDPKCDMPSRWGRENHVKVIAPTDNRNKNDFVSSVNAELSQCLELIHQRQQVLYDNPQADFEHYTLVIDEVLALSDGVAKPIKEAFFSLLSQISLLGRASKVHLLLVSQRFDNNAIPISCREQLNVLIQVGNINSKTTQFLFPDLSLEGIVIPQGIGTGLIQVIDSEHPFQIIPLLTPTFNNLKGVM
ncbi:type IV secretion system DNA-binding domain-containing protein [Paenibacillus abyssi]|uniref:Cell division protein FtsK n=1 Tax=Paenibacillus abyssi TaxID=1340531 RepID=A0A917G5H7_9BACL|nr:type IV secretion system DNA-binding domain-containing protein [Paenibacillus abyssi]GGG23878.1 cell division protein FtsK [Paenibacillus abyssi]